MRFGNIVLRKRLGRFGQTEIFGLVIVVLLVSLLMIFVLSFVINQRGSDLKKSYTDEQMSRNLLKALLTTNVPACRGVGFDDVLVDCFSDSGYQLACQGYTSSCDAASAVASFILNSSINRWEKEYLFYVDATSGQTGDVRFDSATIKQTNSEDECYSAESIEPGKLFLSIDNGQKRIHVRLDICTKEN